MRVLLFLAMLIVINVNSSCICYSQIISTIAGNGIYGYSGDGDSATSAEFFRISSIALDKCNNLFIADCSDRIRMVDNLTGIVTTIAGTGVSGFYGDGGPATAAEFNGACLVFTDSLGNVYVNDAWNYRIRKIDMSTGIISTFAGNGTLAFSPDSTMASVANYDFGGAMTFDHQGNAIYESDFHRIRGITPDGVLFTIAGTGSSGCSGNDGPATSATVSPFAEQIAVDKFNNIYFGDSNFTVRKIDLVTGLIKNVGGSGIGGSYSGEGGPATDAIIDPIAIFVDTIGNIYLAASADQRILKIDTASVISTVAGTGVAGYGGDGGLATNAKLGYPIGVQFDQCGNIFIADWNNQRVRKILNTDICFSCDTTRPAITIQYTKVKYLSIYPNPAQSILEIEALEEINALSIYDAIGKEQLKLNTAGKHATIDIKSLRAGIYFVCVNGVVWRRFLKE